MLVSVSALLAGLLLTALIDRLERNAQNGLWRAEAIAEAKRVGQELRYRVLRERASLVAAATLYAGSAEVTSSELQESAEVIRRSRGTDRTPVIAWLRADRDGRWQIAQTSAIHPLLPPGRILANPPALLSTLGLAAAQAPELQVGELFEEADQSLLALAVAAPNAGVDGLLLEILDFDALLLQVSEGLMKQGMHLRILHPASPGIDHAHAPALGSPAEAFHSEQIDLGAFRWTLEWAFDRDFLPDSRPAASGLIWLAGLLVSVSLALAFYKTLGQQHKIEHEVLKQRVQLEATYADLHKAMQALASQERMAALGRLVAGVAHELNTPIGNALLAASTLDERNRDVQSALQDKSLRQSALVDHLSAIGEAARLVQQNLHRAAALLHGFKQVAVDRTSERRRDFDLHSTVEEIAATLSPQLRGTPHRLQIEVPGNIRMNSYPGPLGQVLSNLIVNSIKHGYEDGRSGTLALQAQRLGADRVELRYSDDGSGVDEGIRERVFEPFFTTQLGTGGSGLGLNIVLNLVQDVLGGSIHCQPSARGALFVLQLPLRAPDHPTADPAG
ncbi:sensor histidine kinase [Aquimonas sp.]|uniref:sensor histidine kinase n=1 Tax=Aquimonas sp. TaxID=1872588 RepID=UPI0037C0B1D7